MEPKTKPTIQPTTQQTAEATTEMTTETTTQPTTETVTEGSEKQDNLLNMAAEETHHQQPTHENRELVRFIPPASDPFRLPQPLSDRNAPLPSLPNVLTTETPSTTPLPSLSNDLTTETPSSSGQFINLPRNIPNIPYRDENELIDIYRIDHDHPAFFDDDLDIYSAPPSPPPPKKVTTEDSFYQENLDNVNKDCSKELNLPEIVYDSDSLVSKIADKIRKVKELWYPLTSWNRIRKEKSKIHHEIKLLEKSLKKLQYRDAHLQSCQSFLVNDPVDFMDTVRKFDPHRPPTPTPEAEPESNIRPPTPPEGKEERGKEEKPKSFLGHIFSVMVEHHKEVERGAVSRDTAPYSSTYTPPRPDDTGRPLWTESGNIYHQGLQGIRSAHYEAEVQRPPPAYWNVDYSYSAPSHYSAPSRPPSPRRLPCGHDPAFCRCGEIAAEIKERYPEPRY